MDPLTSRQPQRSARERLRVPIGVDDAGEPVMLDLKPAALDGMGPHGMLVGAGGSGKPELLRALLHGLAVANPPDELTYLLADFDDGTALRGLEHLPHTLAVVTSLTAEPALVDRLYDVLAGELARRQELLHRSGPYTSRDNYAAARAAGAPLQPMPSLVIVVDGFSELLGSKPDFAGLLVQIGRVGRGLGVHLLLATDVLEAGRLRGIDGYLSYRLGLRMSSAAESRAVIGVSDAYDLPAGSGYLKAGTDKLERFQAASIDPTQVELLVEQLTGHSLPAYEIWPPPLDESPELGALLPPAHAGRGGPLVPVGLVDKPYEHRRDVLWLDLSGDRGSVAIVGRPGSGKTTLLRSLTEALSLTHTPDKVGFARLDLGGGSLPRPEGADPSGVFLVIDGWSALPAEHHSAVVSLAARGVHVLATAERWDEFPTAVKQLFRTKLELRLDDPAGSEIHPGLAGTVPTDRPGRGLTTDKLHFLGALPANKRQ